MVWREKEGSRIRAALLDELRSLLDIRIIDRMPNARVVNCGVKKGVDR